ncbi:MAG: ThuA domain-containing protein, partial [Desulfobacterales bacterium]
LLSYLESIHHVRLKAAQHLPDELTPYDVIVTFSRQYPQSTLANLTGYVRNGGGWLMLVDLAEHQLPDIFGVQPEPAGPAAELRVLFKDAQHPMAARLPDAIYLDGRYQGLKKSDDDTETILYADWHYTHRAVLTYRRAGEGRVACTSLQAYSDANLQPILYRVLHQLAGNRIGDSSIGTGILGYAPSMGDSLPSFASTGRKSDR